jgi:hypothetical protein
MGLGVCPKCDEQQWWDALTDPWCLYCGAWTCPRCGEILDDDERCPNHEDDDDEKDEG